MTLQLDFFLAQLFSLVSSFLLFQMSRCRYHLVPGQRLQTPYPEDSFLRRIKRDPPLSVGDCCGPDCIHTAQQAQTNPVSSTQC